MASELRIDERLLAFCLCLYPQPFRESYGKEMLQLYRDTVREASTSRLRSFLAALSDVLTSALRARLEALSTRRRSRRSAPKLEGSMRTALRDIHHAFRSFRRQPGFAVVAIATIAIGIGFTVAIFSVVDAVVLRPLPFPEPDRLVAFWTGFTNSDQSRFPSSVAEYLDYKADSEVFDDMAAHTDYAFTVTSPSRPAERVSGLVVSWTAFRLFGIEPLIGRTFDADDDVPGNQLALISHGYWQRRYAGDPAVLGQSLVIDGSERRIIGVLKPTAPPPPGSQLADIWVPIGVDRAQIQNRSGHGLRVTGRLRSGDTFEDALAERDLIVSRWQTQYAGLHTSSFDEHPINLVPLLADVTGRVRPLLLLLLGAVTLMLLLVSANVANLLLARAEGRRQELGIRTALGSARSRLAGQCLVESLVLAFSGGLLAVAVAPLAVDLLSSLAPADIPRVETVRVDLRILGFALLATFTTGIVFGLLPALGAARTDAASLLRMGPRGAAAGRRTHHVLGGLVVVQTALAITLVVGSGLLVKSFYTLRTTDPGFSVAGRIAFSVALPEVSFPNVESAVRFYDGVQQGIESLPGTSRVSYVRNLPLRDDVRDEGVELVGHDGDEAAGLSIVYQAVATGYFETMQIPIVEGRAFEASDREGTPAVAIVNRKFVDRYLSPAAGVGQRFRAYFARELGEVEIVGIVADSRSETLATEARPEVYLPMAQTSESNRGWVRTASFVVTLNGPSPPSREAVQEVVSALDPDVPVFRFQTLNDVLDTNVVRERFAGALMSLFAAMSLLIAAVGLYGVLSYAVAMRKRELGLRMALGARPTQLISSVTRSGLALVGLGTLLGIVAAAAGARAMAGLLFGVLPFDPGVYLGSAAVLAIVALGSCALPALRASAIDPRESLMSD